MITKPEIVELESTDKPIFPIDFYLSKKDKPLKTFFWDNDKNQPVEAVKGSDYIFVPMYVMTQEEVDNAIEAMLTYIDEAGLKLIDNYSFFVQPVQYNKTGIAILGACPKDYRPQIRSRSRKSVAIYGSGVARLSEELKEAKDVIGDMISQVNCLPICAAEFFGEKLWDRIQTVMGD